MFKKSLNISAFLLSISIPLSIILFVSNKLNLRITHLVPMIAGITILFALEIAQTLSNNASMRRILTSSSEKLLFAICLVLFWFLFTLPIQYGFLPWYLQYPLQSLAILVFGLYMLRIKDRFTRQ